MLTVKEWSRSTRSVLLALLMVAFAVSTLPDADATATEFGALTSGTQHHSADADHAGDLECHHNGNRVASPCSHAGSSGVLGSMDLVPLPQALVTMLMAPAGEHAPDEFRQTPEAPPPNFR